MADPAPVAPAAPAAAAAAAPDPLEVALRRHEQLRRSTDLPPFYGIRAKDVINPTEFIYRIDNAARAGNWDEARKIVEFRHCLREDALEWWHFLTLVGVPTDNWERINAHFLKTYEVRYTAHTNAVNLRDLPMKPGEDVSRFFSRATHTFRRMLANKPAGMEAQDFFLIQLTISALRDDIREEVMRIGPATLDAVIDEARKAEILLNEKKGKAQVSAIAGIDPLEATEEDVARANPSEDDLYQINLVRSRFQKPPFRPRPGGARRPGGRPFNGGNRDPCRFCKKPGHQQKDCRARIAAKAPLVDQYGKPYRKQVHAVSEEAPPPPEPRRADPNDYQLHSVATALGNLNW